MAWSRIMQVIAPSRKDKILYGFSGHGPPPSHPDPIRSGWMEFRGECLAGDPGPIRGDREMGHAIMYGIAARAKPNAYM